MRIGLVSDTHDAVRPELLAFLRGSDRIVHAGDVCSHGVLEALAAIAPVVAVRGNNDRGAWASALRETEVVRLGTVAVCVVHDLATLRLDLVAERVRVVVSGHSHRPFVEERDGVLHVNPGSAGPRRFRLPISAGELIVEGDAVSARLVDLVATG